MRIRAVLWTLTVFAALSALIYWLAWKNAPPSQSHAHESSSHSVVTLNPKDTHREPPILAVPYKKEPSTLDGWAVLLRTEGGAPAPDVRVAAWEADGPRWIDVGTTGLDGVIVVPLSSPVIVLSRRDLIPRRVNVTELPVRISGYREIDLQQGHAIAGSVRMKGSGTVIPGVSLSLHRGGTGYTVDSDSGVDDVVLSSVSGRTYTKVITSDERGSFSVDGLAEGAHVLLVNAPGYRICGDYPAVSCSAPSRSLDVEVVRIYAGILDIEFAPISTPADRGGFNITPPGPLTSLSGIAEPSVQRRVEVVAARLKPVAAGATRLIIVSESDREEPLGYDVTFGGGRHETTVVRHVPVDLLQASDFGLLRAAKGGHDAGASGQLVVRATMGLEVNVTSENGGFYTATRILAEVDGFVESWYAVAAGDVRIEVRGDDGSQKEWVRSVRPGETIKLDCDALKLGLGVCRFRVSDSGGNPTDSYSATLVSSLRGDGDVLVLGVIGAQMGASFSMALPIGVYSIDAIGLSEGSPRLRTEVHIAAGQSTDVALTIE